MLEHMHYWVDLTYLSICSMNAMTSSEGINRCSSMSRWLAWQMHLIQKLQLFYNKNCCCVFYKKFTLRISLGLFTAIFFFNGNHRLIVCVTCWSWWLKYKFSPKKVRKLSSIKKMSWIAVTINLVVSTTVAKMKVDIPLSQLLSHHHICSVSYKFSTHHLIYIKTLMITPKKWHIKIIPHKEISQTQLWSEAYQNKDRDMSWNFWKFSLQIFKSPKVT